MAVVFDTWSSTSTNEYQLLTNLKGVLGLGDSPSSHRAATEIYRWLRGSDSYSSQHGDGTRYCRLELDPEKQAFLEPLVHLLRTVYEHPRLCDSWGSVMFPTSLIEQYWTRYRHLDTPQRLVWKRLAELTAALAKTGRLPTVADLDLGVEGVAWTDLALCLDKLVKFSLVRRQGDALILVN